MRNRKRTAPFRPNLPAEGKGGRRESKRCGSEAQVTARPSRPALWPAGDGTRLLLPAAPGRSWRANPAAGPVD